MSHFLLLLVRSLTRIYVPSRHNGRCSAPAQMNMEMTRETLMHLPPIIGMFAFFGVVGDAPPLPISYREKGSANPASARA